MYDYASVRAPIIAHPCDHFYAEFPLFSPLPLHSVGASACRARFSPLSFSTQVIPLANKPIEWIAIVGAGLQTCPYAPQPDILIECLIAYNLTNGFANKIASRDRSS